MSEIKEVLHDNVKVTLLIPIQGNRFIEYTRQYIENGEIRPEQNKGALIEKSFSIGLFSNIHYENNRDAYYRAYIMSEFDDKESYKLLFKNGENTINIADPVIRNSDDNRYFSYKTYIIEQQLFDSIRVGCDDFSGRRVRHPYRRNGF